MARDLYAEVRGLPSGTRQTVKIIKQPYKTTGSKGGGTGGGSSNQSKIEEQKKQEQLIEEQKKAFMPKGQSQIREFNQTRVNIFGAIIPNELTSRQDPNYSTSRGDVFIPPEESAIRKFRPNYSTSRGDVFIPPEKSTSKAPNLSTTLGGVFAPPPDISRPEKPPQIKPFTAEFAKQKLGRVIDTVRLDRGEKGIVETWYTPFMKFKEIQLRQEAEVLRRLGIKEQNIQKFQKVTSVTDPLFIQEQTGIGAEKAFRLSTDIDNPLQLVGFATAYALGARGATKWGLNLLQRSAFGREVAKRTPAFIDTPSGQLALNTALNLPLGYGSLRTTQKVLQVTRPEDEQQFLRDKKQRDELIREYRKYAGALPTITEVKEKSRITEGKGGRTLEVETETIERPKGLVIPGTNIVVSPKGLAQEIPLIDLLVLDKEAGRARLRELGKIRGLKGQDLESFIKAGESAVQAESIGEAFAFFTTEASSEFFGQNIINRILNKPQKVPVNKLFSTFSKKTVLPFVALGNIEGASQEIIQQKGRGEEFNPFQVALASVTGGASSGILGTSIGGLSLEGQVLLNTGKKAGGRIGGARILETVANIADPYEKPADLLIGGLGKVAGKSKDPRIRGLFFTPTISVQDTAEKATFGKQTETAKQNIEKQMNTLQLNIVSDINNQVKTLTPTTSKAPTQTDVRNLVKSSIQVSTKQETPTKVKTPEETIQNILTPTEQQTETRTDITSQTPINTFVNINTPVTTPQLRIPPPLPLVPNLFGGGTGGGKVKGVRFVNEIAFSRNVFKELNKGVVAGGLFNALVFGKKQEKKEKTKKKTTKTKKKKMEKGQIIQQDFLFTELDKKLLKQAGLIR